MPDPRDQIDRAADGERKPVVALSPTQMAVLDLIMHRRPDLRGENPATSDRWQKLKYADASAPRPDSTDVNGTNAIEFMTSDPGFPPLAESIDPFPERSLDASSVADRDRAAAIALLHKYNRVNTGAGDGSSAPMPADTAPQAYQTNSIGGPSIRMRNAGTPADIFRPEAAPANGGVDLRMGKYVNPDSIGVIQRAIALLRDR